jgi:inner membrane protease subunit 1
MLPTFNDAGDIVVLDRLTTRWNPIKRGDVVVARSPTNPNQTVCKRIRAVEGDTVKMATYFNNRKISKVPPGHVWLEGDNPSNSTDSRYYGPVPAALITGRVVCKIWPYTECGWMEDITRLAKEKKAIADEIAAKEAEEKAAVEAAKLTAAMAEAATAAVAKAAAAKAAAAEAEEEKAQAGGEVNGGSESQVSETSETKVAKTEAAPGSTKEADTEAKSIKSTE